MSEKLPRGYGGVVKQSGKRSRPYMVRIKVGMIVNKERCTAYPDYKIIGYAKTRKDGIIMLENFHNNPYDLDVKMTFEEVYNKMIDEFIRYQYPKSTNAYNAAFNALQPLHKLMFNEIRVIHLQRAFDNCDKNYPSIRKMKVLVNQVYKWAMKYDVCTKDYSKYVDIVKFKNRNPNKIVRKPFSKEEIDILWDLSDDKYYQIVLMLIYTGVRIGELLNLKKTDVHIEEQYLNVTSSKTEDGIRKVPISDYTKEFFVEWLKYSNAETLLCTINHEPFKYRNFYDSYWIPLLEALNIEHRPHSTRHTCISLLAEAKVDQTTIKKIVGHRGAMTLTERVYTHLDVSTLVDAVNTMYYPSNVVNKKL